jgi:ubiquinone/menaquinone biosynthesis C-methylase UbiE
MTQRRNPQAQQMADESMIRNLAAQANAIWPQEQRFFDRYSLPRAGRIADIGCGSGEITARLAARYPDALITGVDILESSVAHARRVHAHLAPRVQFRVGDAFHLDLADAGFDLVVCRHMTQAIPEPERVLAELLRVCAPGGWIHVLSEDYGMIHTPAGVLDPDRLWHEAVIPFTRGTGTDARIGRRTWALMQALGLEDLRVDYVIVDTVRVPRETFAAIISAWRDGYTHALAQHSALSEVQIRALFDYTIDVILDPLQYAAWHIPIVSGRKQKSVMG